MSSSEQPKTDIRAPLPELNIQDLARMKDEDFWEYARQRAHTVPEPPSHAEYLECKLSGKTCLVALRDLAEVLPPPHRLARLPEMPAWMAGIIAWRGETIAVVDLDYYLFNTEGTDASRATSAMLLIASQNSQTFGLLVPTIGFTSTVELEQITPLSLLASFALTERREVIEGVYADLPVLNISTLLTTLVQQIGIATNHG
jgi:chemotaxis signal transduction protein